MLREENSKLARETQNLEKLSTESKNAKLLAEGLKKEMDDVKLRYDRAQKEANTRVSITSAHLSCTVFGPNYITQLRTELEELNTAKANAENSDKKIQQLKKENDGLQEEISQVRSELDQKLKNQMLDYQQKLLNQENENEKIVKQKISEFKDQMVRLQRQVYRQMQRGLFKTKII